MDLIYMPNSAMFLSAYGRLLWLHVELMNHVIDTIRTRRHIYMLNIQATIIKASIIKWILH